MPSPSAPRLTVESPPAASDEQLVLDGLRAFNVPYIGEPDLAPIGVFVRDDAGAVLGGLTGFVKYRWLYVARLWLPDSLRGQGWGSRVLGAAEAEAWRRDCLGVYLDTFEYQALPFYQRMGYELYGTLEGYPPGYRQYYVRKLNPALPAADSSGA